MELKLHGVMPNNVIFELISSNVVITIQIMENDEIYVDVGSIDVTWDDR